MTTHIRTKKRILGSVSLFGSKVVSFLMQLGFTAYFARSFSLDHFGIWALLSSFVFICTTLDLGFLGSGLRNPFTNETDNEEKRKQFFSVFYISCIAYLLFLIIATFAVPQFPWKESFHIESLSNQQVSSLFLLVAVSVLIRLPFTLSSSVFFADEQTHLKGIFDMVESAIIGVSLLLCIAMQCSFMQSVTIYFTAFAIGPIFSFAFLLRDRNWKLGWVSFTTMKATLRVIGKDSFYLFVINMAAVCLFALFPFLVASMSTIRQAGEFSLLLKLYTLLLGIHYPLILPLWPSIAHARKENQTKWIRKEVIRTMLFTGLLFGLGGGIVTIFHRELIFLWSGVQVSFFPIAFTLYLWVFILGLVNTLTQVLFAYSQFLTQAVYYSFAALNILFLKILIGNINEIKVVILLATLGIIPLFIFQMQKTKKIS